MQNQALHYTLVRPTLANSERKNHPSLLVARPSNHHLQPSFWLASKSGQRTRRQCSAPSSVTDSPQSVTASQNRLPACRGRKRGEEITSILGKQSVFRHHQQQQAKKIAFRLELWLSVRKESVENSRDYHTYGNSWPPEKQTALILWQRMTGRDGVGNPALSALTFTEKAGWVELASCFISSPTFSRG